MRSALVLAGGESQRFRSTRAFALFRGRPMVSWVAEVLASHTDELLVAVGTAGESREMRAALPDATVLIDDRLDAVLVREEAVRSADPDLSSFIDVNRPEDLPKD